MNEFSHSPLLNQIYLNSKKTPEKIALICGDVQVSYSLLMEMIFDTAYFLNEQGIRKGDYVALSAQKEIGFIYVYFASHILGAINVIVDSESNPEKLKYILDLVNPKIVFGFNWEKCVSFQYKDIKRVGKREIDNNFSKDDVAEIVFTTGTTGKPKGVQLTHYNIFSSANNINSFIGNIENDVEILGLPLCHSFGLGRLRCTLVKGGTMILLGSFANIKVFFQAIEKYNVTGFGLVPSVWAYIRKFSGMRISKYSNQFHYIEIGSAAMPIESKKELCEIFPNTRICMHYGLTEASRSSFLEFHSDYDRLSSIGKPVCECVEIKVFDDAGVEIPSGETGELCIKGNMVMKSYYLPADNIHAFWGEYFRTGDLGYKDNNGYFYLVSRKKEIINVGGKKVSPVEVENAICALGVQDCACVGISDPNGILGEVVKAYIQRDGCSISFSEIKQSLEEKLEPYKIPVEYEWIEEIPKTSSGKKQRLYLKK